MKKTSASQSRPPKRRNPVKRLFANFFVLILFAGVIFYFGWVQFSLEEGEYGVFFSKTGGYEEQTLNSGEFNWRWEKLIPTNATLHIVKPASGTINITNKGEFPSAGIYAGFINEEKSIFSWSYTAELFYSLDSEALPLLVKQGYASDPAGWIQNMEKSLVDELQTQLNDEKNISALVKTIPDTSSLISVLEQTFPYFDTLTLTIRNLKYPDRELYRETINLYNDRLKQLKDAETEVLSQKFVKSAEQSSKLELLRQYGEILEEYPILLDFLTLEKPDANDPGIIDSLLPGIE